MSDKTLQILDSWMDHIRLTEQISEEVKSDDARPVKDKGATLQGNRLVLSEQLFQELKKEKQRRGDAFQCALSFPQVYSVYRGQVTYYPLFSMDITGFFGDPYRPDGWDLSQYEFQPSPNNLKQLCGLDEVDVSQLVTQEGIHEFLRRHLGGPYSSLQEFMERFTTTGRRVEANPYLFPPSGSNFTFNLRKDLDDLRTGHRFWAAPGHPAYEYLFGQPKPVVHNTAYLGAFPSDHPLADSQVLVLKHSQRKHGNPITPVQGPPGSGKTTLSLSVCAQQLVERAVRIAEGKSDFSNLTVITSSNNQAVTNVIERLEARYAAEPFWLVGGNRETIDRCALKQLEERIKHLRESAPDPRRRDALKRDILALAAKLRQREESYLSARARWEQAKSRLAELQRGLPDLVHRLEKSTALAKHLEDKIRRLHSYRTFPTDAYRGIQAYLDTTWLQLPNDKANWLVRLWCQLSGRSDERIFRTLSTKIVDMVAQTAGSVFPLSVPTDRSSLAEARHVIAERLKQAADYEESAKALNQAKNTSATYSVTGQVKISISGHLNPAPGWK